MVRTTSKALFMFAALCMSFISGAITAVLRQWGSPVATIHVRNESSQQIRSVAVTYTTCGRTQRLVFNVSDQSEPQPTERDLWLRIVLCGEGSHTTEVMFTNGNALRTKGSYIEGGHEVLERVLESGITSESTRSLP